MSEPAEPADEAPQTEKSEEQQQQSKDPLEVVEDVEERQEEKDQESDTEQSSPKADEIEEKQQPEQQMEQGSEDPLEIVDDEEQLREKQEEEELEQDLERSRVKAEEEEEDDVEEEEEAEEEEEEEEPQEKPLRKSQDTMQLPLANMSDRAIEDEEMPSMVTISSPSKIDDSDSNYKQDEDKRLVDAEGSSPKSSPAKQEDNDSDSVCVIDDDDDEDDGEDQEATSYEEGSSSYRDDESEELSRDDLITYEGQYRDRQHPRNIRRHEEDIEEEDEDEEEDIEDMEDDCDPDDFQEQMVRSTSLQDLSLIRGRSPKRQNINPVSQKARFERSRQINMERRSLGNQYSHVESKVKKYIMDMTEQRRLSWRKKAQEEARYRSQEELQTRRYEEAPRDEVVKACKNMRDYTEKTLKEMAEYEENEDIYKNMQMGVENGEISIFPRRSMGNGELAVRQEEMEIDPIDVESHNDDKKVDKINGTVPIENQNNYVPERKGIIRRDENASKPVLNGDNPSSIVCDLRTLTYDEYMSSSNNKQADEVINDENINSEVVQVSFGKCNNNESEPACAFKIENVVSNFTEEKVEENFHDRKTPTMMVNKSTETYYQESPEVSSLKSQLEQRNSQYESLRDVYQKTMSENLAMKMELENLKKMVANYQEQQKSTPETKVMAIQTETLGPAPSMPLIEFDNNEQEYDPKLGTNSMISAISSQWSESTNSAAISMDPPNVTNVLNSDESANQKSKILSKPKNAFSRAFVTSTRILQTLSSITHGKTKLDKNVTKQSRVSPIPEPSTVAQSKTVPATKVGPSSSKKRKATDTLEMSSSAQPFKIPHISKNELDKKRNSNSPEPRFVNPDDEGDFNKDDINGANVEDEKDDNEIEEIEDEDVKVFVYPEDEEGKEHSFLIQAKEVSNNPKPGVRECGPYLLGNVEVYMTEMNGTINIWGKELSQGSINQNVEELETSTKSKDPRTGLRWQSTPRIFNTHGSVSTGKKSRIMPRFTQQQKRHNSCDINTTAECDSCNSHQRLSWPSCAQSSHENQHTCCSPSTRVEETHCGCAHNIEKRNNHAACCKSQRYFDDRRFSLPNVHQEASPCYHSSHHGHCRSVVQEEQCRHQTFVRRHSFNPTDEEENESDDEENLQQNSIFEHSPCENSSHSRSNNKQVPPTHLRRSSAAGECSEPSLCQNESDPLITQKQNQESSESRKRKSGGKRVRTMLLELLKGCGDCRTPNSIDKSTLRQDASVYAPSTRISCSPNQPACSLRSKNKCSFCRVKNDKTAEIEAQLEFFRIEMDKLRDRSDTLREMLDTLRIDKLDKIN